MKWIITLVALITLALPADAGPKKQDITRHDGYFDFGEVEKYGDGDLSVEVDLTQPMLSIVVSLMKREEPELADMIIDLQQVRVNVFSFEDGQKDDITGLVDRLSEALVDKDWTQMVKIKSEGERVSLYAKIVQQLDTAEGQVNLLAGLVALAVGEEDSFERGDGQREAVFVNIVGNFDLEAIAALIERFEVPHLGDIDAQTTINIH